MKKKNEAVETVLCERVLSAEEVACISVQIQQELEAYIDPVKREYLPRFFKTGKGQYGEGDKFLGVVVPNTRQVAKQHKHEPFGVMATLLQSEWHECRPSQISSRTRIGKSSIISCVSPNRASVG